MTGSIQGRVFNPNTGLYMNRVQVSVVGGNNRAFSNQFGEYRLINVPAGEVTLRVSFTGKRTETKTVTVTAGETAEHDFRLMDVRSDEEYVYELEEYVVRPTFQEVSELAIQEERYSVNLKNVVDTDAYGLIAQGNIGEFVKYIPGVTIGYGGSGDAGGNYSSGADANTISIRGYGANETAITIDGIPIANAAPGTLDPAIGLDMLSINNASRIEVIKVPTPDQPNAGIGGTVNLISKTAFEYPKPTLSFRVSVSANTEQELKPFQKTPGPMNKQTYKILPNADLTYALPLNDKIGLTFTLASANQASENDRLRVNVSRSPEGWHPVEREADETVFGDRTYWLVNDPQFNQWQDTYGADWTNWTEEEFVQMYTAAGVPESRLEEVLEKVKRLPRYDREGNNLGAWAPEDIENYNQLPIFVNRDGEEVGRVLRDYAHPYISRVQVTDSPRISRKLSGGIKLDWRPLKGLLLTTNYSVSTFEDQDAKRRVHQTIGAPTVFGEDFVFSDTGGVRLDTDAFSREGISQTAYIRAQYIRGPWNVRAHYSYSRSESDINTAEKGHFSVVELSMGGIDFTEFLEIDDLGVPQNIYHYRDILDEEGNVVDREQVDIADLTNYGIANYDPEDPTAATLKVRAAGINSLSEVHSVKFDVRRDLDFLPIGFMNLAVKAGADWEERDERKFGRGSNYQFLYVGEEENAPLDIDDFRDETYAGVDPGFGLNPLEWPDVFKLYSYHINNPGAFSDTNDDVPLGGSGTERSVAASNYIEEVNTSKAILETKTAVYAQLEGDFFEGRLSVIGGFRYTERERAGNNPTINRRWRRLFYPRDENQDGFPDVIEAWPEDLDLAPGFEDITPDFMDVTTRPGLDSISDPALRANFATFYGYFEQLGAIYADGTLFSAADYQRVQPRTLRATQLEYVKDFQINEASRGQPQPIISASFDITEKLVARASWSISYSNPPFESSGGAGGTLRRFDFISDESGYGGELRVTNPNLDIARTVSWNAGLTYYTTTGGKFSMNGFYDTEKNRAVNVTFLPSTDRENWEFLMGDLGYGPGSEYWDEEWEVSSDITSLSTFINYGYELEARHDLSFLGIWGKHVYLYGSLSQRFEDVKIAENESDLLDIEEDRSPELNASGGVSISYKRLQVQLNFTWRNERTRDLLDGIIWSDPRIGNPAWYQPGTLDDPIPASELREIKRVSPADLRLDLTASFRITKNLSVDFSARNITESNPLDTYILADGGELPYYGQLVGRSETSSYGINFTIGISGRL
ncbi:MAG: carboxypeptidase regulatory-like domain-containing protein [Puniceicoccaceae bacterium]